MLNRVIVAGAWMACIFNSGLSTAAQLVWTETPEFNTAFVRSGTTDGAAVTSIVSGTQNILGPNGIEYFDGKVYWPDQQIGAILRANPDGTNVQTLVSLTNPYDVAVLGTQLFYAELNSNRIRVKDMSNGSAPTDFLTGLAQPIAVDVTSTHVYFAEFSTGRVSRANLDGTNVTPLFTISGGAKPRDIDVTATHVYAADDFGNIRRADLDGGNLVTLAPVGGLLNGIDVDVANNRIYWSNFFGSIGQVDLDGSNVETIYSRGFGDGVRGVALIQAVPEPQTYVLFALGTLLSAGWARRRT